MHRTPRALTASAGVALLGLVVAAHSRHPGAVSTSPFVTGAAYREVASSFGRVLAIVLVAAVLVGLLTRTESFGRAGRGGRRPSILSAVALLALVVGVAAWALSRPELFDLSLASDGGQPVGDTDLVSTGSEGGGGVVGMLPDPGWLLWTLAIAGLVASAVLAYGARRPRLRTEGLAPTGAGRTQPKESTMLRQFPADPLGRVMAAYHRVERRAKNCGLERSAGETVRTHLRRVADRVGGTAASQLAQIYERARYGASTTDDRCAAAAERAATRLEERLS